MVRNWRGCGSAKNASGIVPHEPSGEKPAPPLFPIEAWEIYRDLSEISVWPLFPSTVNSEPKPNDCFFKGRHKQNTFLSMET